MSASGYAPAYLRDMFCAALVYGASEGAWWEWFVTTDADQFLWRERRGGEWEHLGARARAVWLTDQLLSSTAVVPEQVLALHQMEPGQTYGAVARRLRPSVAADGGIREPDAPADELIPLCSHLPRGLVDALARMSERMGTPRDEIVRRALAAWLDGESGGVRRDN